MIVAVADTHAALWYLFDDVRLSAPACRFLDDAVEFGKQIAISAISVAEVVYLVEKRRLLPTAYTELVDALSDPLHIFTEAALTSSIVGSMRLIPRPLVPDMPDRIIAATALHLDVPVISRDGRILSANLKTVW